MRKLFQLALYLLCCNVTLFPSPAFAAPRKDELEVENIKAPPRDVKDILRLLEQTKPDLVVVERAKKVIGNLYAPFVRKGNPGIFMDEKSAELTKYAANSFLIVYDLIHE